MKDYVTAKEAAEKCGVSSATIAKYIKNGDLKASKPFKYWRIKIKDLEDFMEKRMNS